MLDEVASNSIKAGDFTKIRQAGFKTPKRIVETEAYPEDLTELPDAELGRYLGQYEGYSAWLGYLVSRLEIDLKQAEILLDFVKSKLISQAQGQITVRKQIAESDDFYLECKLQVVTIDAELKLVKSSYDAYDRYARAISREISSRKNSIFGNSGQQ